MSTTGSGVTKKEEFSRIEQTSRGKLIISKELQGEIDYLHSKVGASEWIGILLYKKLEGDIADPSKIVIRAEKLFLMDIGTTSHTQATIGGDDILTMYEKVPDIMELKQGLIHTHHNMSAFFSGEDWSELNDNTPNHNYYLSLIVNFAGSYVAKIAYMADVENKFSFKNSEDKPQVSTISKKVMVVFDMNIFKESIAVNDDFETRYEEMKKAREEAQKKVHIYPYYSPGRNYSQASIAGSGGDGWDREDPEEDSKKDVGEVGQTTTFPRSNGEIITRKEGNRTIFKTVPDTLGISQARGLCLDWLNEGLKMEVVTAPKEFSTIIEAISFFSDHFRMKYFSGEYQSFIHAMQKLLVHVTQDFKPSITSQRFSDILGDYVPTTTLSKVAQDLRELAQGHPQYVTIMRKVWKHENKTKKDQQWVD